MCGAFGITQLVKKDLEDIFDLEDLDISLSALRHLRYSPHSMIPTVSRNSPNKLIMRHWSIIPPWIKDYHDLKYPTFNARSETLTEKATFKHLWSKAQRCVIIASQFYEWKKTYDGKKVVHRQPFTIKLKDQPLAFAGLYAEGETESATIITTEPNHDMKDIHNRMPVILAKEDINKWLDKETDLDEAYKMLQPYPDGELEIKEGLPVEMKPRNSK